MTANIDAAKQIPLENCLSAYSSVVAQDEKNIKVGELLRTTTIQEI